MKYHYLLSILFLLLCTYTIPAYIQQPNQSLTSNEIILPTISIRKPIEDAIIIPDNNPFFGIIASPLACWYDSTTNNDGLVPLLVHKQGKFTQLQQLFLDDYLETTNKTLLVLGNNVAATYNTTVIPGNPPQVALSATQHAFTEASTAMIVPYGTDEAYQLSLHASPLASYLNLPILIYDNNIQELIAICSELHTVQVIIVGDINLSLPSITMIRLESIEAIQNQVATVIKTQFNELNYITMTNPADAMPPIINTTNLTTIIDHVSNIKLTVLSKEIDIIGNATKEYSVNVPIGINHIHIQARFAKYYSVEKWKCINPIIYIYLYDTEGNIVAYANSFGLDFGTTFIETVTCNASGRYKLIVKLYQGIHGGYFIQRGLSILNTDLEVLVNITTLDHPHYPLIPNLSLMAPYLTSAHKGIIVASKDFELTDDNYATKADGLATGPWYTEKLHEYTNQKVNDTLFYLQQNLMLLDTHSLLEGYLNGPAWLALLADTTMIPMYYYSPSQNTFEKGLASDNPYSLNESLSVGRVINWDVQDVSCMISRTLFYETICGQPNGLDDWHNRFSFIFGEGFGETGGIFHQIPYSREITKYGFKATVYGDFRNSRQLATLFNTYQGANYIEYLGHGDWFWFAPSLYGFDSYSKAIDVAHAKHWVYTKPSIFLSSACLMGRVDGIPPQMNIGLTMLHAGCNGFIGATRETGSEAGLSTFENHLIIDNWSTGEALRGEKRVDQELPTYYVRTLYGDPAFNPYEPNNGFSSQGR